jgi:hypothetical protein
MRDEVAVNSLGFCHGFSEELDGLAKAVIRFGATEAQESLAGGTEAFPSQTGNAEMVIRSFEQEYGQPV